MPIYSFATYTDARDEWTIEADSIEHARTLLGDNPDGLWADDALLIDTYAVERRDEFVLDFDDENPLLEEVTPDHWAWRSAHRDYLDHALKQNIAAIAGDFHTHRLYGAFYEQFGRLIDGFVGQYELCIAMAEALTDWEAANGMEQAYENAGVPWIEVVESFVEAVLETATESGVLPDPAQLLPTIQVLARARTSI